MPHSSPSKHAVFSFFSGAGFLDLGFESAGFEVVFANEINEEFVEGYIHSREKMGLPLPHLGIACDSIDDHLEPKASRKMATQIADVRKGGQTVGFIGGPPCPDFSVGGKNRGKEGENGKLTRSYVDLIVQQKPDWFIFENVKGLWRTKRHREFFDEMRDNLEAAGYTLSAKLLNSIQFGVMWARRHGSLPIQVSSSLVFLEDMGRNQGSIGGRFSIGYRRRNGLR